MGIFGIIYAVAFVAVILLFLITFSMGGDDDFYEFSANDLTIFGKIVYWFIFILSLPITGPFLIIVAISAILEYILKLFISLCVK
jgi:hypothetical protein